MSIRGKGEEFLTKNTKEEKNTKKRDQGFLSGGYA